MNDHVPKQQNVRATVFEPAEGERIVSAKPETSYPPEYHFHDARRDERGEWTATAWYWGDDIQVGGRTREEAIDNLVRECWRDARSHR